MVEDLIFEYRRLLELLEEEEQLAARCMEGDLFDTYREVLHKERELIAQQIRKLQYLK